MDSHESGWRVQLSFLCSLLLHAGAIALIALGPTFLLSRGMELGSKTPDAKSQPVDVTIATPAPKPIVAKPATLVRKVRVIKRVVKIERKSATPKPIVRKVYAKKSPVIVAAKKPAVVAVKSPVATKHVVAKPVATRPVATKPMANKQPVIAAQKPAVPSKKPVVAAAPLGSPNSVIRVTQNYLGLRQMPGNTPPVYTRDMRLQHMQGSGQLVYYVKKDGTVSDIHLTKSTGYPQLDEAAIQAFSKYRFYPGQEGYTVHNFEFVLQGPAVSVGGGLRTTMNGN